MNQPNNNPSSNITIIPPLISLYYQVIMLVLNTLTYSFARRVRPLLKFIPTQTQTPVETEQQFVNLENYDFDKRQKLIKTLHKAQQQLIYRDVEQDHTKIVNRLEKGVVWGLGGQLIQLKNKVAGKGIRGTIKDISQFLTLHQAKDIYVHDFLKTSPNSNRKRYSIIGSAFSNRHCYKIGKELKNALDLGKSEKEYYPLMVGRKDDEWILVEFGDFDIHIMTEEERKEMDLEWKWNNPVSEERVEKYLKVANNKNRRGFEPMDEGY